MLEAKRLSQDKNIVVEVVESPSTSTSVSAEAGNYLDPPCHDFKITYLHESASGMEWNFHTQLSRLMTQNVVRSVANDIGGPGYQASGWIYGGGISVAIPVKS